MMPENAAALTRVIRLPAFAPWAVLVGLTAVSWWLADGHGPPRFATVAVLLVAFFKVAVVGKHFMELRHAPLPLRTIFNVWCALVCAVLIALYFGV